MTTALEKLLEDVRTAYHKYRRTMDNLDARQKAILERALAAKAKKSYGQKK